MGEMRTPTMVGVAKSSQSPKFDFGEDIEERGEQMGDNLVAFQKPRGELASKGVFQHLFLTTIVLRACNLV